MDLTALPYFSPIGPPTGYYNGAVFVPLPVTSNNPDVRPLGDGFFNDITRGYTQKAAYASFDVDLLPQALTLTVGTRYFRTDTSEVGSTVGSFGCQLINNPTAPNPCLNHSNFTNLNAEALARTFSAFKSRANLSWKITVDKLVYYTWSQGYRAGGFNRNEFGAEFNSPLAPNGEPSQALADRHGGWVSPLYFAPDNLTNNELGWKTLWMDRRIQWNGAIYQEDWSNAQINVGLNDVISYGVTLNGGNYRVRGVETSGVGRLTTGLTIEAGAAWNHSALVRHAPFLWRDGTPMTSARYRPRADSSSRIPAAHWAAPSPVHPNFRATFERAMSFRSCIGFLGAVIGARPDGSSPRWRANAAAWRPQRPAIGHQHGAALAAGAERELIAAPQRAEQEHCVLEAQER